jgi:hypothetical protein
MNRWQLYQLLCALLGEHDVPAQLQRLTRLDLCRDLLELAEAQAVLPALAHTMTQDADQGQMLPAPWRDSLHKSLLDNVRRNLGVSKTALEAARILNAAGTVPMFFKGSAGLLDKLYPSIGYRILQDIDLLVPKQDIARASEALLAGGFDFCRIDYANRAALRPVETRRERHALQEQYRHHHHLPPLLKRGDGACLELHHHPLPRRWHGRLGLDEILSRAETRDYHGARFLVPDPELAIVLAILSRFASDGLYARYDFPLPQAGDVICQHRRAAGLGAALDGDFIRRKCGRHFPVFAGLLKRLVHHDITDAAASRSQFSLYLGLMRLKANSPSTARALDLQGRIRHVCQVLANDPAKLLHPLGA